MMTFNSLREYIDDAGGSYGYRGSFDSCKLMFKTPNGLVPIESVRIQIDHNGIGSVILSDEEPDGNLG